MLTDYLKFSLLSFQQLLMYLPRVRGSYVEKRLQGEACSLHAEGRNLLCKASIVDSPIFLQIHSVCFCSFLAAQPESSK